MRRWLREAQFFTLSGKLDVRLKVRNRCIRYIKTCTFAFRSTQFRHRVSVKEVNRTITQTPTSGSLHDISHNKVECKEPQTSDYNLLNKKLKSKDTWIENVLTFYSSSC